MHALPIPHIWVQLGVYEQDIQEHILRLRLAEVRIFWHTSLDILEDFLPYCFVLP
jgi:hypothetical protein